jgi:Na+-transporting NADH:ubiquinone oxidoreductase subunit NqrB
MRSQARSLTAWLVALSGIATVTLLVGYASLQEDPYGDGDCNPDISGAGALTELVGIVLFLLIAYGTFAVTRTRSTRWRLMLGVSVAAAATWFAFVFLGFSALTHGVDLTHDWDGGSASTRWLLALGPIAALLLVAGCLIAVNASRLANSRWRYVLGVPFMLLATAGFLVAVIAPFSGTYCS